MRETKLYFYKVFLTNILENETPLLRGFQLLTRAGYPIPVGPGSSFAYPSTGLWNCCSEAKIAKPRLASCITVLSLILCRGCSDFILTNAYLKVGNNENGSACGRWLSIGIYFALWWSTFIFIFIWPPSWNKSISTSAYNSRLNRHRLNDKAWCCKYLRHFSFLSIFLFAAPFLLQLLLADFPHQMRMAMSSFFTEPVAANERE